MNRLRELRKKNKIPAEKLAETLNISVRHLYDLEAGKVQLAEDRIKFLCKEFDVSSDYLLGLSENPKPLNEPNFEVIWKEKTLGDAIARIVNICAEFRLSKQIREEMIDKAIEKYGLPGGDPAHSATLDKGGIAAHGPDYPGSGILDGDKK
jgi:transcriptional regulator with XRE-family HTH domain